jgi:hypothetical protein
MEERTMVRLAVIISVLALFACGSSDTTETGDAAGTAPAESAGAAVTPPVAATPPTSPRAPETPPAAAETAPPQVQSCLDLIAQAKFQQALPVCLAALKLDPTNQQVQDAVNTARAETASAGQAAADASAQLDEATGEAAGKLLP